MASGNQPATEAQLRCIRRMTGYDASATLLSKSQAHAMIGEMLAVPPDARELIIRESILSLERMGAEKLFDVKPVAKDTGLGHQIIYEKALTDAMATNRKGEASALIVLKPATKKFAKWLMQHGKAFKEKGRAGALVYAPSLSFANRFREVLSYYGIDADVVLDP